VLLRKTSSNGVVFYASPKLTAIGVRHAFSTRCGGVSPAPFHSLNLGNPNGESIQDTHQRITENYHRLLAGIECKPDWPLRVHQVHSGDVVDVQTDAPFDVSTCADAIVSRDSRRPISVRTADCVPILISSSDGKTVSAVHAGWRGIIAKILASAVARVVEFSSEPASTLIAAIGPCIGKQAFEVGPEVLAEFEKSFGPSAPVDRSPSGKGHVDLRAAARIQLIAAGVPAENIDSTDRCTWTHDDEFFSHRRDKGLTGRMAAVIAPNGSESA
jgi:YfiH family protein